MRRSVALLFLLSSLLLAGCASAPADSAHAPSVEAAASSSQDRPFVNYTTPDPGGALALHDYAGQITPDEAVNANSPPFGVSVAAFPTCCYYDWVEAPDLLAVDQLVAVRITLNWTNTQADHAGLDAAACLPWQCTVSNRGPDESQSVGPQHDVLTLITVGSQDFLDQGIPYHLGVRYTNAIAPDGLPYQIHVEVSPVGNGLSLLDPYLVSVPANATVRAELVGPFSPTVQAGLMLYGKDDRPLRWIDLEGPAGSRFNLTLPAGDDVLVPFVLHGGFVRLAVDAQPATTTARRLRIESDMTPLATIPDAQAHDGEAEFQAPPASLGDFPWFLYGDGPAAQDAFGLQPRPIGGANVTLSSSTGWIAAVDEYQTGLRVNPLGNMCLTCDGMGKWQPEQYLDDDGTYQLKWHSQGAPGTFILSTERYVR